MMTTEELVAQLHDLENRDTESHLRDMMTGARR